MNYFDCHCDTITAIPDGVSLWDNKLDVNIKAGKELGGLYGQIFAIWGNLREIPKGREQEVFYRYYHRALALFTEQKEVLAFCRTSKEMDEAFSQGKMAAFLAVEDLSLMGEAAREGWKLGIRFAMLTWNYENRYGAGAVADDKAHLTKEGLAVARELSSQGVILDVSHLSQAGFSDLLQAVEEPVIASHSNARSICNHVRNLTDGQIQELIRRRGLIGLNMCRTFVKKEGVLSDVLLHAEHILSLGGEDALAMGCDFDGCNGNFPTGITGLTSIPALYQAFADAFGERTAKKVFFENAVAFLRENL